MGVNLPFKNVILSIDKIESVTGDNKDARLTSLTFTDIENMGGRAGRLNSGKKEEFGRVIFIAHSLISECIYKNLYFNFLRDGVEKGKVAEEVIPYPETGDVDGAGVIAGPGKREKDLDTLLLRLIVGGKDTLDTILAGINEGSLREASSASLPEGKEHHGYWQFIIDKKRCREKIGDSLVRLKKEQLITENDRKIFSATDAGTLVIAKGIKVDTYLYFLSWLKGSIKGELNPLEIIFTLTLSEDGKALPIPYPQFYRKGYKEGRYRHTDWKEIYRNKLLNLVFELGEEGKEVYQGEHGLQKGKTGLDDYLAFKKTLLLHDWIGSREIKSIEQEYSLYRGAVKRLGEGFSWLADCLAAVAEDAGWKKEREKDLEKIKCLSGRLVEGVEEEGLMLAQLHIPGLTRSYIRRLVKEGYNDEDCLREVGENGLEAILPGRLVKRIQERIKEEKRKEKKGQEQELKKEKGNDKEMGKEKLKKKPVGESGYEKSGIGNLQAVLEIDKRRPDRIIFEGNEVKVSAKRYALLYFLAKHIREVVSYNQLLEEIWKDDENAIYTRILEHLYQLKKNILRVTGNNNGQKEKINQLFRVIPGRGIMLNIGKKELKIN